MATATPGIPIALKHEIMLDHFGHRDWSRPLFNQNGRFPIVTSLFLYLIDDPLISLNFWEPTWGSPPEPRHKESQSTAREVPA